MDKLPENNPNKIDFEHPDKDNGDRDKKIKPQKPNISEKLRHPSGQGEDRRR